MLKCRNGHNVTPENTYTYPVTGYTDCRICRSDYAVRRRKANPNDQGRADDNHRYGGNREKAILRDREACVRCGMTREEHKSKYRRDITIDHIDGKGINHRAGQKNNSIDNLQTLCLSCHGKKDVKRTSHVIKFLEQEKERL